MANSNLQAAKKAKNDEFYTCFRDIDLEIAHYEDKFRDKVVFCNCDDPTWSNFWRYFHMDFTRLGLKKLIATHYEAGEVQTYKIEYTGGNDLDFEDGVITPLEQNGDFRSDECIELLKEADIVVTNPPFSLFREYVSLLLEHNKKFLIIGSMNAITYKEVFPCLKNNIFWLGNNSPKEFLQPDGTIKNFGNILWYTNLDHNKRHEMIETAYKYSKRDELYPELYPKYDNYDAINVDKVKEIPMDYNGVMGVPITFLSVYNPEQFGIVGLLQSSTDEQAGIPNLRYYNDFKEMRQDMTYTGASGGKANGNPVVKGKSLKGNFLYNDKTDEYVHSVYARILIKRKEGN